MKTYQGKTICEGFAAGKPLIYQRTITEPVRLQITDVKEQLERLNKAKLTAMDQLNLLREKALSTLGKDQAMIFESHIAILEDPEFHQSITLRIESESINAEYAVLEASREYADFFDSMGDPFLAERGSDVEDVARRLIACLASDQNTQVTPLEFESGKKYILCAEELTPSEALSLRPDAVLAILLAYGSPTTHASILAKSKNIPAIIGLGPEFLTDLSEDTLLLVNASDGAVIIEPTEQMQAQHREKQEIYEKAQAQLQSMRSLESVTLDGTRIELCANIGSIEDAKEANAQNADGIGLFRSEFLYSASTDYPSEEAQFQTYRAVLELMPGKRVIIRTLDVGADKQIGYFNLEKEANPALGMRAIRLCLTRPELFKTQLRALYRASVYGKLGIMFPMITSVSEVERILAMCEEVKNALRSENVPFNEKLELGIMIETPAAAMISDRLAPLVDFFSVGTNDLTQYTLAMDRQNASLAPFIDTHHEAVLRMIQMSADNAHKNGAWIGICGELAADFSLTESFLRMGIDELSVSPSALLSLREKVRSLDLRTV